MYKVDCDKVYDRANIFATVSKFNSMSHGAASLGFIYAIGGEDMLYMYTIPPPFAVLW
jgi:hypothetical protein